MVSHAGQLLPTQVALHGTERDHDDEGEEGRPDQPGDGAHAGQHEHGRSGAEQHDERPGDQRASPLPRRRRDLDAAPVSEADVSPGITVSARGAGAAP